MKKCFAVAISILIILMSCSEHKKVEKVLTWEDSVDMALKGYVYTNYPNVSLCSITQIRNLQKLYHQRNTLRPYDLCHCGLDPQTHPIR